MKKLDQGINYQMEQTQFLNALLAGEHNQCSSILNLCISNKLSIQNIYEQIIKRSMYEVGLLWERNEISVAREHLCSAIVEALLNEMYHHIASQDKKEKSIVMACVPNEYHQIGIKMISDIFEMYNWKTHFLGANIPNKELVEFSKIINPELIGISLSIYFHLPSLEVMIKELRMEFPNKPILIGGQAFSRGGKEIFKKHDNITFLNDLYQTETFIKNYNNGQDNIN